MQSERPIDIERKLRNGDITVREFTRKICKSTIYRNFYFDSISQYKSIKLRYKHILGRPIKSQIEVTQSSNILNNLGFGFPACLTGVTVPTSMKPTPSAAKQSIYSPSLSSPAAIPNLFL